jgi:CobQ-like glutamine amidotransferase family enzyme
MNWIFVVLCWVMGVVFSDEGPVERIRARARCRDIRVKSHDVVVRFTCEEDARLFAEDLKNFVSE